MALTLAKIEFAAVERRRVARIGKLLLHGGLGQTGKLREELFTALFHRVRDFRLVVGEIEEGVRGRKLLSLKQHGRGRSMQQERRHGFMNAGCGNRMRTATEAAVGDLVVILDEVDKGRGGQPKD